MEKLANLFGKLERPQKKTRRTERGDLLDYFLLELNPQRKKDGFKPLNHGRIQFVLKGIPTKDLYALRSHMEDAKNRGYSASKRFWWELKPRI